MSIVHPLSSLIGLTVVFTRSAGIYSDSGWYTCGGFPGSWGNEAVDINTFHQWGFEYLKYDNCAIPFDSITRQNELGRYQIMANAIAALARKTNSPPFSLALCEWGWQQVQIWGRTVGQSWRVNSPFAFMHSLNSHNLIPR